MSTIKKTAKKKPKPRAGLDRPRCNGKWTEAKFRGFIVSALRKASSRWDPKFTCIKNCFVEVGINPATGYKCKLHKCPECNGLFPQGAMKADHIVPVVGPEGFVDFNTFILRLFVESDGYQALCENCHNLKTNEERAERSQEKSTYVLSPD